MTQTLVLNGPRRPPASGGPARQLVVLLHGLGADGNDLIGLTPVLAKLLPDAAFVSPNAPERCDMAPMGYQWFSLRSFEPSIMHAGAKRAAPILNRFLDSELERLKLDDSRMALLGFSQGTMMALYVALRRPKACAGVLGFSGALLAPEVLEREATAKPPILLVHGDADEVVPVHALYDAVQGLGAAGLAAEWHVSRGMPHGIGPDGLELGGAFLRRCLSSVAVAS